MITYPNYHTRCTYPKTTQLNEIEKKITSGNAPRKETLSLRILYIHID